PPNSARTITPATTTTSSVAWMVMAYATPSARWRPEQLERAGDAALVGADRPRQERDCHQEDRDREHDGELRRREAEHEEVVGGDGAQEREHDRGDAVGERQDDGAGRGGEEARDGRAEVARRRDCATDESRPASAEPGEAPAHEPPPESEIEVDEGDARDH